jgi:hypothetical protein
MSIDLNSLSVEHSRKIHNNELGAGGFAIDITFTNLGTTPSSQTVKGFFTDVDIDGINPENLLPIRGNRISVSVHQADLSPLWDGKADVQRWKVSFTNNAGQDVEAEVSDVIPDRVFGDCVFILYIISGHTNGS